MTDKSQELTDNQVAWRKTKWGARYDMKRSTTLALFARGEGPALATIPGTSIEIVTAEADAEWRANLKSKEVAQS